MVYPIYSDANKIYMYMYLICRDQSNFDITNIKDLYTRQITNP